jgi:hypothetical protein
MIDDKKHCLLTYLNKKLADLVLSRISVFALCREQNARVELKNGQYQIVLDSDADKYPLTLDRLRAVAYYTEIKWLADNSN